VVRGPVQKLTRAGKRIEEEKISQGELGPAMSGEAEKQLPVRYSPLTFCPSPSKLHERWWQNPSSACTELDAVVAGTIKEHDTVLLLGSVSR